ncbi:Dps DNA-binding ferritin-like protein (oxidative damage protectant) [uncultured Caudovirales phage]|uniref:Dps DNA-binding ferritin-like protein (Oxidative damage protectant) n=1 Tax=uncultured Caudovirales phage TaxID=2100421 RepID=A0A6J7X3A4_9CAUD|nr:Dps DNA-binding ferritin-like protein (oxidative damage protectant) [uncultured Caudovirales phage]
MLVEQLKTTQADAFTLYLKAHFYHWNIEGFSFPYLHEFLNDFYQDVFDSVDTIAELVRTLDSYAPGTLGRFKALTGIEEDESIPDAKTMISNIYKENLKMLASLIKSYDMATKENEIGVANFLQDRIQAHEKHSWMLKSILK